jgi:protein-disulfide isomerase
MSKGFWGVVVGIILVFIGIIAINSGGDKTDKSKSSKSDVVLSQHIKGKGTTNVTLVEYGDYQCPYCQQYEATVEAVIAKYGDQIKFQFRNFPISSAHPNAFAAARAAEAADQQGKFWEMHDLLYATQNYQVWTRETDPNVTFQRYAKLIGLNVAKFKTDFASSKVNNIINADLAEGTKLNVTGTPSFFLNGKKIEITNTIEAFEKIINQAIAKQKPA